MTGSQAETAGLRADAPLRVLGSEVSYFTGKLEAYLRYKEIPYELEPGMGSRKHIGVLQMPAAQLPDGRWMSDTTPMIAWLESQRPEPAVIPRDPVQAWFSRLLEDHADEWLWRPAMHYRWDYRTDSLLLRRKLVVETMGHIPLPAFVKRWMIYFRQRHNFTRRDGVSRETWSHVENSYLESLFQLRAILSDRPFLLGTMPSLADFGFFGPMFRHFGLDPTPSRIMRETAPEVYEWLARLWNARASRTRGQLVEGIPDDWGPILDTIGRTHLESLCANAEAWKRRDRHFDMEIEGVRYRRLRVSRYRVFCLEQLRAQYERLHEPSRAAVRARLEKHGAWEPLYRVDAPGSGLDPEGRAPFAPSASMTGFGPG